MGAVVFEEADVERRPVRLHQSRWDHICANHPEMAGEESGVRATIADPNYVVRSKHPAAESGAFRLVACRRGAHSRYVNLWLVVPIEYGAQENWVVTAYVKPVPADGEPEYVRIP